MILEAMVCMALNVYHEARGEPFIGQVAVAEVVLNRIDDKRWPNDACGVIYQSQQFSWTLDESKLSSTPKDIIAYNRAFQAVKYARSNRSMNATHYHHKDIIPLWSKHPRMDYLFTIENHKFYYEE